MTIQPIQIEQVSVGEYAIATGQWKGQVIAHVTREDHAGGPVWSVFPSPRVKGYMHAGESIVCFHHANYDAMLYELLSLAYKLAANLQYQETFPAR